MDLSAQIILGIFLTLITLASVFGNFLVCVAIYRERSLRITCNYYILSLAIADLLVSLLVFPLSTGLVIAQPPAWTFGHFLCFLFVFGDVMFCTASILNLCAISVDRYRAIATPMDYAMNRSLKSTCVVIVACWCISALVALVMVLTFREETNVFLENEMCALPSHPAFVVVSSLISFFVPSIVMIALYIKIIQVMRSRSGWNRSKTVQIRSSRIMPQKSNGESSSSSQTAQDTGKGKTTPSQAVSDQASTKPTQNIKQSNPGLSDQQCDSSGVIINKRKAIVSKERKAAKTLGIVMVVFFLCWAPYFCGHILNSVCCELSFTVYQVLTWLGYANSALNPLLYTMFNPDFRAAFYKILTCKNA